MGIVFASSSCEMIDYFRPDIPAVTAWSESEAWRRLGRGRTPSELHYTALEWPVACGVCAWCRTLGSLAFMAVRLPFLWLERCPEV